jgi:predicted ATPase/class 3 adenylate cyclase
MDDLPRGTVTFLFSDIAGSTRRWEEDAPRLMRDIARRDRVLRAVAARHGGIPFKQIDDAFQVAFDDAPSAVAAAVAAQRELATAELPDEPVRVRMALQTGQAEPKGGDYLASWLHHLAQLLSAAHGGQTLLFEETYALAQHALPNGVSLRDLGIHRLRDLREPERIWQVVAPDLVADFPELASLTARPNNLPLQLTAFVGREDEIARCVAMLRDPAVRMLVLTGPGGVGKTRLALQVAAELSHDFDDGMFYVDLSPLERHELVLAAIAETLDVREAGAATTETILAESIGSRSLLLLLDSFERVAGAAPEVVRLLDCPHLKLLVTSRSSLRVRAEREVPVGPLPVPASDDATPASGDTPSVRLFMDRATADNPDFALTADNARAVTEICRRLEGLPLAIELAAARVRLFPPDALLARLERRLPLLTSGALDAPARQRTLRDTIDWSHDLLGPEQQALFARLSIFAGGCSIPAIEAIADDLGAGVQLELVETLDALVQHHLVRQSAAAGEPRFSMLETIREFGVEQLEASAQMPAVARRHARIFLDLVEQAVPALRDGIDEPRWLRALELEHDNFRAALNWSLRYESLTAVRLAGALSRFWSARGHLSEGRAWLEQAIAGAPPDDPARAAQLLHAAGRIALLQGDYARSVSLHERSLALWQATNDLVQIAWAETALADAVGLAGDEPRAINLYVAALALFRGHNVEQGVSIVQNNLGVRAQMRGEWDRAAALYEESLAIDRRRGDTTSILVTLGNLGDVALERERIDEAATRFHESLQLAWELEDAITSLQGLIGLGRVAVQSGDFPRGARLLAAAEAQSETIGTPLQPGERAGFDAAVGAAMTALGEQEGRRIWQEGTTSTFREVVLAELSSPADRSSPTTEVRTGL